uniref:Uncharacterized protein n=1 Tax=Anguilla anguilla TaxID=7936 RepID=A0A0E9USX7_ANGAN
MDFKLHFKYGNNIKCNMKFFYFDFLTLFVNS